MQLLQVKSIFSFCQLSEPKISAFFSNKGLSSAMPWLIQSLTELLFLHLAPRTFDFNIQRNQMKWSPIVLKLRAISLVSINAKGYQFDTHFCNNKFTQFTFNYVVVINN